MLILGMFEGIGEEAGEKIFTGVKGGGYDGAAKCMIYTIICLLTSDYSTHRQIIMIDGSALLSDFQSCIHKVYSVGL
jgi:hypothetical protein